MDISELRSRVMLKVSAVPTARGDDLKGWRERRMMESVASVIVQCEVKKPVRRC